MLEILFNTFTELVLSWHGLCYARVVDTRVCLELVIEISDKNISQFTNTSTNTTYWIALETDSKYTG